MFYYATNARSVANCVAAVFLAGIMTTAAVSTASAQTREIVVTAPVIPKDALVARVSYADLNLNAEAGLMRLNTRIRGAVRKVCPAASHLDAKEYQWTSRCRMDAFSQAAKQVDLLKVGRFATRSGAFTIAARR